MKISVPKETQSGETRAPMTPDGAAKLVKLGAQVEVEAGLGVAAGFPDEAYARAGATVDPTEARVVGMAAVDASPTRTAPRLPPPPIA